VSGGGEAPARLRGGAGLIEEDGGFEWDVSYIQTETGHICQAELNTVTGKV
jgi:hypothetical protein